MGQGELLLRLAKRLKERKYDVLIVISPRDTKEKTIVDSKNRNFEDALRKENMEFIISKDINNEKNLMKKINENTIGISLGAAWIFKEEFIKKFNGRLVNTHGTRLPQDRGGGDFSWRILRGERLGYNIIHVIDPGVDTGTIIKYREYLYPHWCRIPNDYRKHSIEKYLELLEEFIDEIEKKQEFKEINQQEYFSSYWPRLCTDIHGYINWKWKLKELDSFICAFDDPYKGATTFVKDMKVRLKKSSISVNDGPFHPFQKGIIYRISKNLLFVATEDGTLIINSIEDEKGNNIIDKIKVGDRFFTPSEYLEKAMQFRAVYTPSGLKCEEKKQKN